MLRILFRRVSWLGLIGMAFALMPAPAAVGQQKKAEPSGAEKATAAAAKVDINSATERQLEGLPGIGKATAGKIIAGRPYSSADDLAKAGVSKSTIAKIAPLVTVGSAPAAAKPAPAAPATPVAKPTAPVAAPSGAEKATAAASKVDINSATEKQLEELPGVGEATAGKIIAGRPYSSADELAKAGVSKSTIAKIAPLVTVSSAPAAAKPVPAAPVTSEAKPTAPLAASPAKTAPEAPTAYTPPPAAGMVWVNLESKVYHKEGDRWYGMTKKGKYMTEADAIKAGYRAAKEKEKK